MITQLRYTIAPAYVEHLMAVKNKVEIDGLRRAYLRDGAAFVSLKVTLNVLLYDTVILGSVPGLVRGQTAGGI